jgi:hypothetical protein
VSALAGRASVIRAASSGVAGENTSDTIRPPCLDLITWVQTGATGPSQSGIITLVQLAL